jgi:hypothetical protein
MRQRFSKQQRQKRQNIHSFLSVKMLKNQKIRQPKPSFVA